jgi:hypothetical protein
MNLYHCSQLEPLMLAINVLLCDVTLRLLCISKSTCPHQKIAVSRTQN